MKENGRRVKTKIMPFDKFTDTDSITEDRRKAVAKSVQTIDVEELKKLAEEIFHFADDPRNKSCFNSSRNIRARHFTARMQARKDAIDQRP
jgi:hypothetical protein